MGHEGFHLDAVGLGELHRTSESLNVQIAQGRGADTSSDYLWQDGDDRGSADPLAAIYGEKYVGVSVLSRISKNNRLGLVVDPDPEDEVSDEVSGVELGVRANLVGLELVGDDEGEGDSDLTDEIGDDEIEDDGIEDGDEDFGNDLIPYAGGFQRERKRFPGSKIRKEFIKQLRPSSPISPISKLPAETRPNTKP